MSIRGLSVTIASAVLLESDSRLSLPSTLHLEAAVRPQHISRGVTTTPGRTLSHEQWAIVLLVWLSPELGSGGGVDCLCFCNTSGEWRRIKTYQPIHSYTTASLAP